MAKTLHLVFDAARILAIAICLLVLIASLVMWPRSLFYLDYVGIPFVAGSFPLVQTPGSLGGTITGGYPCVKSMSGHISIIGTGPRPYGEFTSGLQRQTTHFEFAVPTTTGWLPQYYPTRPVLSLPYWLTGFAAITGLLLCFPGRSWDWIRRPRVSIADVLLVTLAVALVITAAQLSGHADGLIVGEILVLAFVAMKSFNRREMTSERSSSIDLGIGVAALVGVLTAAAFAIFTHVAYSTHFVPVAVL